jgi:hypothetical protein
MAAQSGTVIVSINIMSIKNYEIFTEEIKKRDGISVQSPENEQNLRVKSGKTRGTEFKYEDFSTFTPSGSTLYAD